MEIKNCSIYPRYEESLPKISRIPEFALFMYHRHGKSNRVKCLPHSNGQALIPAFSQRLFHRHGRCAAWCPCHFHGLLRASAGGQGEQYGGGNDMAHKVFLEVADRREVVWQTCRGIGEWLTS